MEMELFLLSRLLIVTKLAQSLELVILSWSE